MVISDRYKVTIVYIVIQGYTVCCIYSLDSRKFNEDTTQNYTIENIPRKQKMQYKIHKCNSTFWCSEKGFHYLLCYWFLFVSLYFP